MKTVNDQPQVRMVNLLDDPPGVVEGSYIRAPGERLIANLQLSQRGALSQLAQLSCRQIVVDHVGSGVRACGRSATIKAA